MIKSIFFIGVLFYTVALESEETVDNSSTESLISQVFTEKSSQKVKKTADSKNEDKKPAKTEDVKEDKKTANKDSAQKGKRQVAGTAYSCSELWTDEFSAGYVQVGAKCSPGDSLCLAFFHIARNYCEEDHLIRYYCDPKQPSLFSTEKIKCEKSCEFSGLSGVCIK
ncbi:MAG: hypothetical protein OXJ52_05950 [Oligoflexia bacterium]|nr:hypothetical protein [Oligoflexia bacterium]